ncbi:hypothetical protein MB02_08230 [Croceicoccus estronivorus]|uniref:hypothetical protein n=1 Tax=Croceicoccus estronivorus TaxID=1172626 RepID=UPI00082E9DE8|nr:hypothetical protein [Croceicoccus estronivorus]OCC23816.1 hypothetical protein MB02_08230 [Croceicoccus estronivorus]
MLEGAKALGWHFSVGLQPGYNAFSASQMRSMNAQVAKARFFSNAFTVARLVEVADSVLVMSGK